MQNTYVSHREYFVLELHLPFPECRLYRCQDSRAQSNISLRRRVKIQMKYKKWMGDMDGGENKRYFLFDKTHEHTKRHQICEATSDGSNARRDFMIVDKE